MVYYSQCIVFFTTTFHFPAELESIYKKEKKVNVNGKCTWAKILMQAFFNTQRFLHGKN